MQWRARIAFVAALLAGPVAALRRLHGADYDRYAAAVARFLPGLGRRRAA